MAATLQVFVNIPAGPLDAALIQFAAQTHQQLLYSPDTIAGLSAPAVHGRYTAKRVLGLLLAGSHVTAERTAPNVFILSRDRATTEPQAPARPLKPAPVIPPPAPTPRAQAVLSPVNLQSDTADDRTSAVDPSVPPLPPQEIVVTGSHIRGVKAIASPMLQITPDTLQRDGDATVADALDRLPQNFNGQATPNSLLVGSDRAETNVTLSQGVNLRGIGPSGTLVLINGRRLAGSGIQGDFTDVSSIPTAAVDHIDVLLDGASAIYGSDAVGGVVNVVMKRDFIGAESSVRYGEDAGGVGGSLQIAQTVGAGWDGGHLLLSYEYQHDDHLPANARRFASNANLTALGGTDHDVIFSAPGNILTLNAAGTGYISAYAIPGGSGMNLTAADFNAGLANELNFKSGSDIQPRQDRNGLYFDLDQAVDSKTSIDLQGHYNLRVYQANSPPPETAFSVSAANPYFVSPNGARSELIGYSTADAVGPQRQSGTDKSFDVSVGLDRDLGHRWRLEAYVGFAEDVGRSFDGGAINSAHLNEALGNTPDNPATAFSTAANGYFNPYGDGRSNSKTILNFITDGFARYVDDSQITTANIQADGVLFSLPGGEVKAAFGTQYRHERFEPTFYANVSASPILQGDVAFDRDVSAVYGELNIPLVGRANARVGLEALNLSIAGRVEHYDDVGTTANPKIGIAWTLLHGVSVHATYGTSFRAPALSEINQPITISPEMISNGSSTVLALFQLGGNPGLKPQTAQTWTAGVDWKPASIPGLRLGVGWFDIDFKDQIAEPGVANSNVVLTDPAYAELVTRIDGANAAQVAQVQALLNKSTSATAGLFPASAYSAIVDGQYVNTASLIVRGVDVNLDYAFDYARSRFAITGSASYLYDYIQQATPLAAPEQLVSTAGYPVNFRGRLTGDWSRGPYDAAVTLNYVNNYRDPVANRSIAAWTTIDLSATWRSSAAGGPTRGVTVTAAVQNLLDSDPPFYDSFLGIGYDPANANPLGRVVSLRIAKRW